MVLALVVLALAGCSSPRPEPGLLGHRRPAPPSPSASQTAALPEPTNRHLPVLGEQIWTTGEGLAVTVRFAVHAVRRMAGATILDWSVTPLSAPGLAFGDRIPSTVDLGLDRDDNGDQRIYLVDGRGQVYRPLTHKNPDVFHHCLCTPLWVAEIDLRIGETRMLQLAFAPLPADVDHVDVALANSVPFWHVPVTGAGTVPLAGRAVDLARPEDALPALSPARPFTVADRPGDRRAIRLLDLETSRSGTTLTWSVSSLDQPGRGTIGPFGPPVSAAYRDDARLRSGNVASGPELVSSSGSVLRTRWITSEEPGPGYLECLCSQFGLWSRALRAAGGSVAVSTTYAPLPAGTRQVDVVLPGIGTLADVPVRRPSIDPGSAGPGVGRTSQTTWTYSMWNPPGGWPTSAWPTPLPDQSQLTDYRARVDRLVDLPAA